jgi:hypothetical protein
MADSTVEHPRPHMHNDDEMMDIKCRVGTTQFVGFSGSYSISSPLIMITLSTYGIQPLSYKLYNICVS